VKNDDKLHEGLKEMTAEMMRMIVDAPSYFNIVVNNSVGIIVEELTIDESLRDLKEFGKVVKSIKDKPDRDKFLNIQLEILTQVEDKNNLFIYLVKRFSVASLFIVQTGFDELTIDSVCFNFERIIEFLYLFIEAYDEDMEMEDVRKLGALLSERFNRTHKVDDDLNDNGLYI
jgi:hypothetical protein